MELQHYILTMENLNMLFNSFSAAVVIAAVVYGFFKWVSDALSARTSKRNAVTRSFEETVAHLSSENSVSQLSSAILLRRYMKEYVHGFDVRRSKIYFLKEQTLNVISSTLRTLPTSVLQKTLADGLAYAGDISNADLQRTNLQDIYLGNKAQRIVMREADLFRADLSFGLIENVDAQRAILYHAILLGTRIKNSDFSYANFQSADLSKCSFTDCRLYMADFKGAYNVPEKIADHLKDGIFVDDIDVSTSYVGSGKTVFFSMPGAMTKDEELLVKEFKTILNAKGFDVVYYTRDTYPRFGQLGRIRHSVRGCCGMVAFGFKQIDIQRGVFRPGTTDEEQWSDKWISTPWNELEVGMGLMNDIPVLLVQDKDLNFGVFDSVISEIFVITLSTDTDMRTLEQNPRFMHWMSLIK